MLLKLPSFGGAFSEENLHFTVVNRSFMLRNKNICSEIVVFPKELLHNRILSAKRIK